MIYNLGFYSRLLLFKIIDLGFLSKKIPDKYYLVNYFGGKIYIKPIESPMMRQRLLGIYEYHKAEYLKKMLKPGMIFIDVGANKGYFTFLGAKILKESGRVISIEPNKENIFWLKKSMNKNNYTNVEILNLAISEKNGNKKLYKGNISGNSSLLYDHGFGSYKVKSINLDTLSKHYNLKHIDFIKVDVEGAELKLLKGADVVLSSYRPEILLDIHEIDRKEFLKIFDKYKYLLYSLSTYPKKLNRKMFLNGKINEILAKPY